MPNKGQDSRGWQCLHHLFEAQAARTPDQPAVEYEGQALSYRALNAQANQLAHYLRRRGIRPNTRVALCFDPNPDFAVATLAVLKAGGTCVPLDPKYPAERLAYMVEDAQAQIVISADAHKGNAHGAEILDLGHIREEVSHESQIDSASGAAPKDAAYLIYTSGSTGKPRGVVLAHRGLANYVMAAARVYGTGTGDRVLQFCSISFDIALEEMFVAWTSGATLILRSPQLPLAVPRFVDWIRRHKVTILDLPTAYWHEWVNHFAELREPVPQDVRLVIVGGEKARSSALATWRTSVGNRLRWVNTYGPTEASIAVTLFEPNLAAEAELPANIPIGRPVENCRVYVLDPHLKPVPVGAAGELHIGGICVATEYWNRPELTLQKFIPDPFSLDPEARLYKTGDVVRTLPSGELEYLGRTDEQVKIRGFRVELGEIEEVLARHPLVREAVVVAVDDERRGKSLVAHVVCAEESVAKGPNLREHLHRTLPDHMMPSAFVFAHTLPKTPNGKIDRRALSERPFPEIRQQAPVEHANDSLEQQILDIWQDALGQKPLSVLDNFFELGGHSLLAARVMHRISRATGQIVPLAVLFEAPTVRQLAALLREKTWSQRVSCLVPIQPNGMRPPLFCVHGVGGNVLGFRELSRRMAPEYPVYGLQSRGLDGAANTISQVEEMAAHYIREMRSVQPEGPFLIGGYSFGGLVAYEMAQQLTGGGEQVALLALLDTYPGNLEPLGLSMLRLARNPARLALVRDFSAIAKGSVRRRLKNVFLSPVLKNVLRANQQAAASYKLRPYRGKMTLFRAREFSLRSVSDPHAEWLDLTPGGLDVHEVAGGHGDLLVPPQVDELARKLKECIDACAWTGRPLPRSEERAFA
jgi:aspartate racemase